MVAHSHGQAAGSLTHSPRLALPPLSPERAWTRRPSGPSTVGPKSRGTGSPAPAAPGPGGGAVAAGGGTAWRRPSGGTTVCSTIAWGTRAGQYAPEAEPAPGG